MSKPGFVSEDALDELRMQMADLLQADLSADEDDLEYLLEYGTKRVGAKTPEELSGWLRDTYRQTIKHMKGRTTGSPTGDVAHFLRLMEGLDAGTAR